MRVRLWGTRGTVPTPVSANYKYGGNTPCIEVRMPDDELLILDAGLGLYWLGDALQSDGFGRGTGHAHILVSHTHWGHIQGIPFFLPMLISGNSFEIYGSGDGTDSLAALLVEQMNASYCPVPNFFDDRIGANVTIREIVDLEFDIGSTHVTARRVNHVPDSICLGYRLDDDDASLAYIPDVEYLLPEHRDPAIELARDVDLLIHDAHLTSSEYASRRGCGHSTDGDAIALARDAGARRLLLFHHHPDHSDVSIDAMVGAHASASLPVEAAREGAEFVLNGTR